MSSALAQALIDQQLPRFGLKILVAGAMVCVSAGTSLAQAQTLPAATSSVLCTTNAGNVIDPIGCNTSNDRAQVSLSPAPALSASGDLPGGPAFIQAAANAQLSYSFAVLGGQAGDLVHLDITTLLHWATQGSSNSYAFTRVIVTTSLGEVTASICSLLCGSGTGVTDFYGDLHLDALSGAIDTVAMDVSASAAVSQNASSASAFADPRISISPANPNASKYTLIFSDGVGNAVSAVPEPDAWILMLAGCAAVGWRARRRARQPTAGASPGL